ncbi:hypothetical protein FOPE_01918 [Fonsecaea pedrosoi]|nr:hypothetical protein FOPE_01918 [Fonsecaea pedrosoi]
MGVTKVHANRMQWVYIWVDIKKDGPPPLPLTGHGILSLYIRNRNNPVSRLPPGHPTLRNAGRISLIFTLALGVGGLMIPVPFGASPNKNLNSGAA